MRRSVLCLQPSRTASVRKALRRASYFLAALALSLGGCGAPGAKVSGKVTCGGKPVAGTVLFSPQGEGAANTGEAVSATLGPDGSYSLELKTTGKHRVVVSPSDVPYPAKPGQEYPCDLAPQVLDINAGPNTSNIELKPRGK